MKRQIESIPKAGNGHFQEIWDKEKSADLLIQKRNEKISFKRTTI